MDDIDYGSMERKRQVSVKLTTEIYDGLKVLCGLSGMNLSELIRFIINKEFSGNRGLKCIRYHDELFKYKNVRKGYHMGREVC